MIQSGGFLTGTVINPEKEIPKTTDGLGSLMATLVKEWVSMGNKGILVNAGLSLLGRKFQRKIYGSGITLTYNEVKDISN